MVKGMTTCKVCGRDFTLLAEEHYSGIDPAYTGIIGAITVREEPKLFDCFDCPHCGCQNVLQDRKRFYIPTPIDVEENEEEQSCCCNCGCADDER